MSLVCLPYRNKLVKIEVKIEVKMDEIGRNQSIACISKSWSVLYVSRRGKKSRGNCKSRWRRQSANLINWQRWYTWPCDGWSISGLNYKRLAISHVPLSCCHCGVTFLPGWWDLKLLSHLLVPIFIQIYLHAHPPSLQLISYTTHCIHRSQ